MIKTSNKLKINDILKKHYLFKDMSPEKVIFIAENSEIKNFNANYTLAKEDDDANYFYIILSGRVKIITHVPTKGYLNLQTLHEQDVFGWSWIFPPYKWSFDAVTVDKTSCLVIDGVKTRKLCEQFPTFGYELMKKFALILSQRLSATRIQLLDIYGKTST